MYKLPVATCRAFVVLMPKLMNISLFFTEIKISYFLNIHHACCCIAVVLLISYKIREIG